MKERGMDDDELAGRIGVCPRTVGAYRRLEVEPPRDRFTAIARALNVSEVELRKDSPFPEIYFPSTP